MPVRALSVWRGLILAGLGIAGWAVVRVILLVTGHDVVANSDRHGYMAVFSLVLVPVLLLAIGSLALGWRRRSVMPGVALALSSLLAYPLVVPALVVGVALVVVALVDPL